MHRSHESPNIFSSRFTLIFIRFIVEPRRLHVKIGVGDAYIKIEFHEIIDHTRRLCTTIKRVVVRTFGVRDYPAIHLKVYTATDTLVRTYHTYIYITHYYIDSPV